jgi:hypothetical protein
MFADDAVPQNSPVRHPRRLSYGSARRAPLLDKPSGAPAQARAREPGVLLVGETRSAALVQIVIATNQHLERTEAEERFPMTVC